MTEAEAKAWLLDCFGSTSVNRLSRLVDRLRDEAKRQNLVSAATLETLWSRHIADSAQLLSHAPSNYRHWVDVGSGAGLPGLVIAALTDQPITLVEPRRLRVDFLNAVASDLELENVTVIAAKAERATDVGYADVISARAVAKLDVLLAVTRHFSNGSTTFVFPKGESAQSEVAAISRTWHGTFHVEQSIVDPTSGIVVATGVRPR